MDSRFKKLQLVLSTEEQTRYEEVYRRVQSRTDLPVELSQIVKRIAGLEEPNSLITQADVDFFRGKVNRSIHHIQDLGTAELGSAAAAAAVESKASPRGSKKKLIEITGQTSEKRRAK